MPHRRAKKLRGKKKLKEYSDRLLMIPFFSIYEYLEGIVRIKELLPKQVVSPVLWEKSLRAVLDSGVEDSVEVGTGKVLAGTLKRINRKFPCKNYGDA